MANKSNLKITITLSIFLITTILLSFWGFNSSTKATDEIVATGFSISSFLDAEKAKLDENTVKQINALEADLEDSRGTAKSTILTTIATSWEKAGSLPASAIYAHKLAHHNPSKETWEKAANQLYGSLGFIQDSATTVYYYSQAEEAYNHLLELDPDNTQAKINLAVCLVDYKQQVMQGVQMLKQVLEEDENNEQALYILGLLSIRSTQYNKALERFEKLVSLHPENPEYRILLGNTLNTLGKKEEAIATYETAIPLLDDDEAVERVNNIIKDIKEN